VDVEAERIHMADIGWSDLDRIHELHSTPAVDEFNTLGIPRTIEDTRVFMAPLIAEQDRTPRKRYCWAIREKATGNFLGLAGLTLGEHRFRAGEIYYKLLPTAWGQGYATETARALVVWGFSHLQLHRIEAGVAVDNVRSIRVLERTGMTREGRSRKVLPIRGEWKDNYRYAILEDDPRGY
jgi:ribosomal-protein-alanine N-acetyltransferase